jgi:hypothetical protein
MVDGSSRILPFEEISDELPNWPDGGIEIKFLTRLLRKESLVWGVLREKEERDHLIK